MIIYFDLDGVLTDCHMSALSYCGLELDEYPQGMRVKDILDTQGIETPLDYDEFWAAFPMDFWSTLPKSDFCDKLVELAAETIGKRNVFIASRPADNIESYSGKANWVRDNLPEWIWKQLILIENKSLLARHRETILIDDSPNNCTSFESEGGESLLIRRPWNGHDNMSWKDLVEEFYDLPFER